MGTKNNSNAQKNSLGYLDPWKGARWIAVDPDGLVHARINGCHWKTARAIALVMFPEIEAVLIVPWKNATSEQRAAGHDAPVLTPATCARQGIQIQAKEPKPVKFWAKKLNGHFGSAAGGGQ